MVANKKAKPVLKGTLRIKTKDCNVYKRTSNSWEKSLNEFPLAMHVVELFCAHNNLDFLVDVKNPEFLKGHVSPEGKPQGARISVLPDGRKLDKAYSLFADHLAIHDESSNTHWDVIYRNPGGTYSYVYTLEKKGMANEKKYLVVEDFEKRYPELKRNAAAALLNRNDNLAVPIYTILKTYMRIGNEIYYKAHGHKGLTTLKKSDITITGNSVTFNYLGKGGVPRTITEEFPSAYITRLKEILKPIENSSFVFVNPKTGHPLLDSQFKDGFKRYCGEAFYPHIVRSFYATKTAEEFLQTHKAATKKEVRELFLPIADKLGHRKFSKKKNEWEDNYTATIHHHIKPELVERVNGIVK